MAMGTKEGCKKKTTIEDLKHAIDSSSDAPSVEFPTSPDSIEAFQRLGIDPAWLRVQPIEFYMRKHGPSGADLARIEYEYWTDKRNEILDNLIEERDEVKREQKNNDYEKQDEGILVNTSSFVDERRNVGWKWLDDSTIEKFK